MADLLPVPERSSAVVKGYVRMEECGEIPKIIIIVVIDSSTGRIIGKYKPNKETGNYVIIQRQGKDYIFNC